jgi:Dolichyl-phosphate-mannose-protein mannosyltransferase
VTTAATGLQQAGGRLSGRSAVFFYRRLVVVAARVLWARLERSPGRSLIIALLLAIALRLPFASWPLGADEGGFLLVARQWDGDGPFLYDGQWVDRPPVLLLVFKLGSLLGGEVGLRALSLGFAGLMIVGAWWSGRLLNGARGALVAALVAAALGSNFLFDGFELGGEGIAGAFVLLSSAATLAVIHADGDRRRCLWLSVVAGFLAGLAILTKQNFIDAVVFAGAVLASKPRARWAVYLCWATGLAIPLSGALWWAERQAQGVGPFLQAMYGFRRRAATTIADNLGAAQLQQMTGILAVVLVSGIVWLVCQLIARSVRPGPDRRLSVALLLMLAYGVFSIAAGMGWWRHYLLELVPVLAMGTALMSARPMMSYRRISSVRVATAGVLASALIATALGAVGASAAQGGGGHDVEVSEWLRDVSHSHDTVVLAFGAPNVIEMSGLSTPYPYSWTLQVRVLDPHLNALVALLNSRRAPTWLVQIASARDMAELDNTRFDAARATHYRWVDTVCGHPIYLRRDATRVLPPPPDCPGGLGW